jgi:hypothetical protein
MMNQRVVREGAVAGVLGAMAVAVWFLAVDLVVAAPFYTPRLLGRALFGIFTESARDATLWPIVGYTVVHVAAFIGIGMLVAKVVELSDRTPAIMAGLFLLFAVLEVSFYMLSALLATFGAIGALAWYQVLLANLVAAGVMGGYLWHEHPEIVPRLHAALRGTT